MSFKYRYDFPVRYADTDAQGIVFFANYLTYCDEGLTAYMREIGCSWQVFVKTGVDMVYRAVSCEYLGSASFGMTVGVKVTVTRIGNSSLTSHFEIVDIATGTVINRAQVTNVCIDHETRESVSVPQLLRDAVASYEG